MRVLDLPKIVVISAVGALLTAAPSMAQTERGYVTGTAGFATDHDGTSADVLGEGGVRLAPHVLLFGNIGRFHNLQPSAVQPAVDQAVAALTSADGPVGLHGDPRVPAWYSTGGLRLDLPTHGRVTPYVLGGAGFAHIAPAAKFNLTGGVLPDSTSIAGDDVTSQVIALGYFTQPAASNAFLSSFGGGIAIPLARHITADASYRFSHVATDTPVNAQGAAFGLGYRF
jgi:opacity protein-like surface antigen